MRAKLFMIVVSLLVAGGVYGQASVVQQQCDRQNLSPIRCGYWEEGYQDGANDARAGRDSDHRRYRAKFESLYEQFYRDGYEAGFKNTGGRLRWTDVQKNAYDLGYNDGERDRDRRISRLPARYEGQYDRAYEAYYRQGYFDGYDDRDRRYDFPVEGGGTLPTLPRPGGQTGRRGTATGTLTWNGRVDDRVNIVIKGDTVNTQTVSGSLSQTYHTLAGTLPRRGVDFTIAKLDGRGTAFVLQQPARENDYTAIIQVYDPRRGNDNYNLRVTWALKRQEPYSSGRVVWRGRVDQTANIAISGGDVEVVEYAGPLTDVSFTFDGYLAARPGSVTVRKLEGRGTFTVLEQPGPQNDYTALIQIFDPRGGDDSYEIEVIW